MLSLSSQIVSTYHTNSLLADSKGYNNVWTSFPMAPDEVRGFPNFHRRMHQLTNRHKVVPPLWHIFNFLKSNCTMILDIVICCKLDNSHCPRGDVATSSYAEQHDSSVCVKRLKKGHIRYQVPGGSRVPSLNTVIHRRSRASRKDQRRAHCCHTQVDHDQHQNPQSCMLRWQRSIAH